MSATPAIKSSMRLEQLVAKSLVSARPEGASTRYRLLDTTKAYAMQKLVEAGEAQDIARRHAGYVQRALETTMAESSGGDQASRSQERAGLLADARAALTWGYANDDGADLRVPLAGACARLFVELNLLNEGRLWSSRALAALDDTNRGSAWELELQSTLGHAFMFTERNSEQAESALRRGLEIAEAPRRPVQQVQAAGTAEHVLSPDRRVSAPAAGRPRSREGCRADRRHRRVSRAPRHCLGFPTTSSATRRKRRFIWMKACRAMRRCAAPSRAILPTPERHRFRSRASCGCVAFPTGRSNAFAR